MESRLRIIYLTLLVVLAIPAVLLAVVAYPLTILFDEISGGGRRYRRRRSQMVEGRPPVADPEFLRAVGAAEADAPLWLGIRSALAEYCGAPPEAIHPDDRMADLWPMHWDGPDHLDLVFRLERTLGVKIRRGDMESVWRAMKGDEDFAAFAGLVVSELHRIAA